GRYHPALERLEARDCPSLAVTNLAISPTNLNEGASATLTGNIAGSSVGDIDLAITWGDGSAVQHLSLAAGSQSFSAAHTYLDDVGAGTSAAQPVSVTATDAGPALIAGPDTAGYRAYDVPAPNLLLASGQAGTTELTTLTAGSRDDGYYTISLSGT